MLNPIQTFLDDGCPNTQGVDDLPMFAPHDLDPRDHDGRGDDDSPVIDVE
jgi:hypothetical protein